MSAGRVVCPFCPLHCDDVLVDPAGDVDVECPIAKAGFKNAMSPPVYRIGDERIAMDESTSLVSQRMAGTPTVACSGATLGLARKLAALSAAGRIRLTLDSTPTQAAMRLAMSRDGFIGATLGDIKMHADLVWLIGDPRFQTPRLARHFSEHAELVSFDRFSVRRLDEFEVSAKSPAKYQAIIFADDAFEDDEALVAAEWWCRSIVRANQRRRVVSLMLDPSHTLRSVAGWASNESLQLGPPEVDIRFGDPVVGRARLQIGGSDPGIEKAQAFVATKVPGVHQSDAVIRGDGAVTMGLERIHQTETDRPESVGFF